MIPRSPGIFLENSLHKGLFLAYITYKNSSKRMRREMYFSPPKRKILLQVTAVAMQLVLVGFFEGFEAALHFSTLLQLVGIA